MKTDKTEQIDKLAHQLQQRLREILPSGQLPLVETALRLAAQAHKDQVRDDGTPYIIHPIRVALIVVEQLSIRNAETICVALLHDTIEDCPDITVGLITQQFGSDIANMVQ